MDFIITVCDNAAAETCPSWPGRPTSAHWGIPDPSTATGTDAEIAKEFERAHDTLLHRIKSFLAIPFDKLERQAVQDKLDEIGLL